MSVPLLDPVTALFILRTFIGITRSKIMVMLSSERFLTGWNEIKGLITREGFGRP